MKAPRGCRIVLRLRPGVLAAEAMSGASVLWAGEFSWDGMEDLPGALADLVSTPALDRDCRALWVFVERPLMQLRRCTDLPPVRQAMLKSLAQTQSTRYFRRNGTSLVTDARWTELDGTRTAQLCAMDASLLEVLADGARTAGLRLVSVVPAEGEGLSLLPPSTRAARLDRLRRSLVRWSLVAGMLWALVGATYLARLTLERRRVDAALQRLEAPAAALRVLRQDIRTAREMTEAVAAAEQSGHDLTHQLAAIATALPDSAFLTSLTLSAAGTGVATGYAPRAADVAASFERAPGIRAPRLDGRRGREALLGREWDRFSIAFGDSVGPGGPRHGR